MALDKKEKQELIEKFAQTEKDTGSCAVQIAVLTGKIRILTDHLKKNYHDFSSKRGLLKMVARRRKFLQYLERTDVQQYNNLLKQLELKELKRQQ